MLGLFKLLQQPVTPAVTVGMWRVAQLHIDPATGEQLNVGIVFTDEASGKVTTRFLQNVAGIRCLYNDDLAADASFLIDQAEHAIELGMALPANWNISLSQPLVARGANAKAIVDQLFARMVPLGLKEQLEDRLDGDDHPHTTANVRKQVRELLKKHMQSKTPPDFWSNNPICTLQEGREVQIDLQISGPGKAGQHCGTITSAWYKTKFHRNAYLDKASNAVVKAKQIYPNASVVMYLLEPDTSAPFSADEKRQISADIEGARWMVEASGGTTHTFAEERAMAHRILQDMAVIG